MALFNWAQNFEDIPEDWRQTQGAGIRIAMLDSGVDLNHSALNHLDADGHKFDVTRPDFDPGDIANGGNDDVMDAMPSGRPHGTQLTSILAARDMDGQGIIGIAPESEIFHIKMTDENKETYLEYFVRGIRVALHFEVDLICVCSIPIFRNPGDQALSELVFREILHSDSIIISTLVNTRILEKLNDLEYPTNKAGCIATGVLQNGLIDVLTTGDLFNDNIFSLMTEAQVEYCLEDNKYGAGKMTSSYATSCITGVAALFLSHWNQTDPPPNPDRKEALTDALRGLHRDLSLSVLRAEEPKLLRSYHPHIIP